MSLISLVKALTLKMVKIIRVSFARIAQRIKGRNPVASPGQSSQFHLGRKRCV